MVQMSMRTMILMLTSIYDGRRYILLLWQLTLSMSNCCWLTGLIPTLERMMVALRYMKPQGVGAFTAYGNCNSGAGKMTTLKLSNYLSPLGAMSMLKQTRVGRHFSPLLE